MPRGGAREGSGRPLDVVRKMCQEAIWNDKLIERLAKIANGSRVQQVVNDQGEELSVPSAIRDQLRATEVLLDRAYGKAEQPVDMNVNDSSNRPSLEELRVAYEIAKSHRAGDQMDRGK